MLQKTVAATSAVVLGTAILTAASPATADESAQREKPVTINVMSDIQGDLEDFDTVLDAYASFPRADHMVVNGDLVPNGLSAEYQAFFDVLADHEHPDATYTIGNHEFDGDSSSNANVDRFLEHTGMPEIYHAREVDGVPLIHLGSLENPGEWAVGNQATLGQRQLRWLDAQLDRYGKHEPVLVFGHHPLPHSVSGTVGEGRQDYYDLDYAESERLLEILGEHPHVVFFSGHTHYNLERSDWMNRVTTPEGDPRGFLAVNTGGLQTEWGPNPGGPNKGEWSGEASYKQALRVTVEGERVTVTSLDFETREVIRKVSITMRGNHRSVELPTPAWPQAAAPHR